MRCSYSTGSSSGCAPVGLARRNRPPLNDATSNPPRPSGMMRQPGSGRRMRGSRRRRTRRAQLPDDRRAVRDPQVARVVFDQAVDVGGRAVDEAQQPAVVAIEAARGPDPHAAGAILVDAERLLAVVAVGVGHARPAVAGVAEQPVTGRRPHRAATILEERVDAGRCTVGGGIVRDAATMDPSHASAPGKAHPHATLRGTGERGNRAGRQRAATALRPRLEACAVESDETAWRAEPEIAVEVLSDREHVAGLFVGPRGERVADGRWGLGAGGGDSRQSAGGERQRQRADPSNDGPGHEAVSCRPADPCDRLPSTSRTPARACPDTASSPVPGLCR